MYCQLQSCKQIAQKNKTVSNSLKYDQNKFSKHVTGKSRY
jgi:hypothetical protein